MSGFRTLFIYASLLTIGVCFGCHITRSGVSQPVPSKQLTERSTASASSKVDARLQRLRDALAQSRSQRSQSNSRRTVSSTSSSVAQIAEEEYRKLKPYQDEVHIVENQEGVFVYPQDMSYMESTVYIDKLAKCFPAKTIQWHSKGTPYERFEIK